MKYITKNQNEFGNLVAFHLNAFDKWVNKKSNLHDDGVVNIKNTPKDIKHGMFFIL